MAYSWPSQEKTFARISWGTTSAPSWTVCSCSMVQAGWKREALQPHHNAPHSEMNARSSSRKGGAQRCLHTFISRCLEPCGCQGWGMGYSMLLGILRSWKVTPSLLAAFAATPSFLCLHIPITSSPSLCSHFSFLLATCLFPCNLSSAVTAFGWPVSAVVPGEGIMPHSSTKAQ